MRRAMLVVVVAACSRTTPSQQQPTAQKEPPPAPAPYGGAVITKVDGALAEVSEHPAVILAKNFDEHGIAWPKGQEIVALVVDPTVTYKRLFAALRQGADAGVTRFDLVLQNKDGRGVVSVTMAKPAPAEGSANALIAVKPTRGEQAKVGAPSTAIDPPAPPASPPLHLIVAITSAKVVVFTIDVPSEDSGSLKNPYLDLAANGGMFDAAKIAATMQAHAPNHDVFVLSDRDLPFQTLAAVLVATQPYPVMLGAGLQ
jgi:hypothetical protein